jgi:hypothetical protein
MEWLHRGRLGWKILPEINFSMKYRFLIVAISLLTTLGFGQKVTFNIKYSEPLAVFVFTKSLTTNYGDNPFKIEFNKSKYFTQKYQDLIAQLDTLRTDYTYLFSEFPYGSKIPGMTEALLKKNLIASNSILDFKLRSVGLITNTSLNQLATILSEFTPIYNELIFNPNKTKFESQLAAISAFTETKNITNYFETGLTFYSSVWDNSIPFEIVFYPLPNSKGFTAGAFYNNAVSAIQTDLKDYNVLFSVVLHEIFHILYDEQPLVVKNELDAYFKRNPSKCSIYAYLLLNEVLATALGNGYVFENLNEKSDTSKWYNWRYINLMAKEIYPTVLEYVEQKKPIDKYFIDTYIKLYEQTYPNWINEIENTMTYRYTLSENQLDFDIFSQLYPYCSISEAEDQINEASIEKMKGTPLTKVIIVSKNNNYQLALIKKSFPELQKWKYQSQNEFTYNVFLGDRTQLYIINQHKTPTEVLIKKFGQQTK